MKRQEFSTEEKMTIIETCQCGSVEFTLENDPNLTENDLNRLRTFVSKYTAKSKEKDLGERSA